MKKVIFGFFVLTVMFASSCKKTTSSAYGSWSFKGTSYNGITAVQSGSGSGVEVFNSTNDIDIAFSPALTASGTVTSNNFTLTLGNSSNVYSNYNTNTGNNGAGSVTASVSGGNVNVSSTGSGVMVYNSTNAADSGYVTFSGLN